MLSDAAIRRAGTRDRPYRLADAGGLYLWITPAGGKHWRMRYEVGGRERVLTLGPYPEVTLAAARAARDAARAQRREGRDPAVERRKRRLVGISSGGTFEALARAWHARNAPRWTERHAADVLTSLAEPFEALAGIPIDEITSPMVLTVLRRIEARPAVETAYRVRQRMSAVFAYAAGEGLAVSDPAAVVLANLAPLVRGRQPAILDLDSARAMLRIVEASVAHPGTKLAHRLLALTAVRPGEVLGMPWCEVEGDAWRIPAGRMKMRREHVVPLAPAALAVLDAMREMSGRGALVFPNTRWAHRPMSENAIGYMLNRAGFAGRHVPHGWRATFSTVMNERFRGDRDVIDLMLAHAPRDATEAAYNRAAHMGRRRELAEVWAGLVLDGAVDVGELMVGPRR